MSTYKTVAGFSTLSPRDGQERVVGTEECDTDLFIASSNTIIYTVLSPQGHFSQADGTAAELEDEDGHPSPYVRVAPKPALGMDTCAGSLHRKHKKKNR